MDKKKYTSGLNIHCIQDGNEFHLIHIPFEKKLLVSSKEVEKILNDYKKLFYDIDNQKIFLQTKQDLLVIKNMELNTSIFKIKLSNFSYE